MVRNSVDGCKAKRMGRQFATTEIMYDLQLEFNTAELCACVSKIYGGAILVITIDGEELLCTIRKEFKGSLDAVQ
jgi:hypothetical protein